MSEDFPDICLECLLKQPYHHDEPWTCPACGLIHAVVMPGVPLAEPGVVGLRRLVLDLGPLEQPG